MAGKMAGKTALVTGGASGIGRAIALAFADEGVNVVIADINEKGGKESVRLLELVGNKAFFMRCNVSKNGEVEELIAEVVMVFE